MAGKKNLISYFRLGYPLCISRCRVSIIKASAVHNLPVAFACPSHAPGSWPVRGTWLPASAGRITNKHSTLTSQLSRGISSGYKSKLPAHKQGRFISIFPFPFHFSSLRSFSYLFHFSLHLHYFYRYRPRKAVTIIDYIKYSN